ncbi:MAG: NERD domain-containing protein [Burkholderiales bacterium]|nr:NERD domain-containing protein [Burkholderiales bacterium]
MKEPRWTSISESNFAWEKEALDWLRNLLPDRDPWHVWSNFEFIDDEGKVNEVDALVLSPVGIFLVEIKSRPGVLTGDAHTWTWRTDGRDYAYDNPLILANRKAKRLATLLRRQSSVIKAKSRVPFIEPLIFLSAISADTFKLAGNGRSGVFLKGRPDSSNDDGIVARLEGTGELPAQWSLLSHGIRPRLPRCYRSGRAAVNKHRRIGDYQLGALIQEGENYQDWEGEHVSAGVRRRVRIYGYALASTVEARQSLVRQATREFQILEGVDHPGILRVRDFKESELGPALLFDFNPQGAGSIFCCASRQPAQRRSTTFHSSAVGRNAEVRSPEEVDPQGLVAAEHPCSESGWPQFQACHHELATCCPRRPEHRAITADCRWCIGRNADAHGRYAACRRVRG